MWRNLVKAEVEKVLIVRLRTKESIKSKIHISIAEIELEKTLVHLKGEKNVIYGDRITGSKRRQIRMKGREIPKNRERERESWSHEEKEMPLTAYEEETQGCKKY